MKLKWLINTTAIALIIVAAFLGMARHDVAVAAQDDGSKIEGALLDKFTADGNADFIVRFVDQADLSAAYSMDWQARGEFVYNALKDTAANSQTNAKAILDNSGFKYQTFISGNELYVWNGTLASATELAALPEVSSIRATRTYAVDPYVVTSKLANITWAGDYLARAAITTAGDTPDATTDWGITDTKADQFWAAYGFQGDGIVVANIDTGVQWNHPALDQAFKCGNDPTNPACWSDPSNICGAAGACDNAGHGTHTMGTMVGDDDPSLQYIVGMAPNAQWIACKGCESNSCSDFALNSCADWILAPGGSADNRPNVVNNSWGGGGGDTWYLTKVNNWRAAGIFPAFSAGNNYTCSSMGSPGDYQESFASASHMSNRTISDFSSKGPSPFGDTPYTKPNISAPGSNICSSVPGNGWSCGYSGTSMASPHTAGAVALLWSCNPALVGQIDQTFQVLQDNADIAPAGSCGAPADGEGNYTYGYGYLDVLSAGLVSCGAADFGALDGYVRDSVGDPIEGASVNAVISVNGNQVQAITDPTGYYTMTIPVNIYDVTASKVNYTSQTVTNVEILTGQVTSQDFVLTALGSWNQIAPPPGCPDWTRYDGEYFPADGLVYFMGGRSGTTTDGTIYSYDPVANVCANTGETMPTPISNYTINLVNNGSADVLCTFGGRDSAGGSTLNVQCYNPATNTASVVTNLPAAWTGYGPYAQVVVDNMVYIFGGFNNLTPPYTTARTDRYDPVGNTFTQMGDLSMARSYVFAAAVDGKIYAFGGDTFDGVNLISQTIAEVFDPATQTWDDAAVADLPLASGEGRAYGFDSNSIYELAGQIVLAGGGQWPAGTNEVLSYDVASNTYDEAFPNLNVSRRDQAGFFIAGAAGEPGRMWAFGGRSDDVGYGGDNPPYAPPEYFDVALGVEAPSITVDPMTLSAQVLPGASTTQPMTITNNGNADLTWTLTDGAFTASWSDNFDSYETGSSMHGQGGWKGWANSPAATAYTSDVQAVSAPNSVAIEGASDLVHEYAGYNSGTWVYTAKQFVPDSFSGQTYFILLNSYDDAGTNLNWSTEVVFDSGTGMISNDGPDGGTLPLIKGEWVEIRVEIDLDADTQTFYYGGDELFSGSWTNGMSGGGVLNIAAVDLYANTATVVYYDDISLGSFEDTPWLSEEPASGTTLPGENSPVVVTFDATGLAVGEYFTTLFVASNDPSTPMIEIPVNLTVLAQADLSITKTASPEPVMVGQDLTYTIVVANDGPQDATGVTVVDTLPEGVTFVSASEGCTPPADGTVTCTVGDLASGNVATITIVVTPDVEGTITNTAVVSGNENDPDPANNTASAVTTVEPAFIYFYLPFVAKP